MMSLLDKWKARSALTIKCAPNLPLHAIRAVVFLRLQPPREPARSVVHLIGNVGDIVVATPSLIALRERYPTSRLVLITSAGERKKKLVGAEDLLARVWF